LCAIKASVVGASAKLVNGKTVRYDETRVRERSGIIAIAIDGRAQRYQMGKRFHYKPLTGFEVKNSFNEETREQIVKNYSLLALHI
jgi:hypothetical protein